MEGHVARSGEILVRAHVSHNSCPIFPFVFGRVAEESEDAVRCSFKTIVAIVSDLNEVSSKVTV